MVFYWLLPTTWPDQLGGGFYRRQSVSSRPRCVLRRPFPGAAFNELRWETLGGTGWERSLDSFAEMPFCRRGAREWNRSSREPRPRSLYAPRPAGRRQKQPKRCNQCAGTISWSMAAVPARDPSGELVRAGAVPTAWVELF